MSATVHFPTDAGKVSTAELAAFVDRLSALDTDVSDAERVEQLGLLETLKAGAAAGQARVSAAFDASQRAEQAATGVPAAKRGTGIASQVALARRESPNTGARHLGLAKALVFEMPHTLGALSQGLLSEWRATLLVRETAHLSAEHRAIVDEQLCADPTVLDGVGDAGIVQAAKKLAYRLDPAAAVRRAAKAAADRRVSIRPAPDTMAYVTGLLPVADGVAVHAALTRHVDTCKAQGDARTRGQIMADTFTERLTGRAGATGGAVELQLVMTDVSVFGTTSNATTSRTGGAGSTGSAGDDPVHEPGLVTAPGLAGQVIPAALGRQLLRAADQVWIRRLFAHPETGELVATDSRRRLFPKQLRVQIVVRDQICRTPWCDAPSRHRDHAVPMRTAGRPASSTVRGSAKPATTPSRRPAGTTCPHDATADIASTSSPPPEPRTAPMRHRNPDTDLGPRRPASWNGSSRATWIRRPDSRGAWLDRSMRYALTGATGFVGGALATQLRAAGHDVAALVRDPSRAGALADQGIELIAGDLDDAPALDRLCAGADGLFHVAGWYKLGQRDPSVGHRVNVEGTRNTLEAARRNEVPRVVYTSTLAINSDTGGRAVDESHHFDGEHISAYDRTKAEAHVIAKRFADEGLPVVMVQPGVVYGPGDTAQTGQLVQQVACGKRVLAPKGGAMCWAHVDDVAAGHVLAMENGSPGESYMFAGPRASLAEALQMTARIAGTKGPVLLPEAAIRLTAAVTGRLERVVPLPSDYTAETLRASQATYLGTAAKAQRELGWTARPLEEGLRQTVDAIGC